MTRTAFVATYPPQLCGIATSTSDLAAAAGSHAIVALRPPESLDPHPPEVGHGIRREVHGYDWQAATWLDAAAYRRVFERVVPAEKSEALSACSTMRPKYITATLSQIRSTSRRSWAMNR